MEPLNNRGFTLIEVVVALLILVITFTILYNLLHSAGNQYSKTKKEWENFLCAVKKEKGEEIDYKGFKIEVRSCGGVKFFLLKQ